MKIVRCKTNHLVNPIGYTLETPVLTWVATDAQGKQPVGARSVVSEQPDMSDLLLDTFFSADIKGWVLSCTSRRSLEPAISGR